jgi:hypothetical protein
MRRSIGRLVSVVTLVAAALVAAVSTTGGPLPAGAQAADPTGEFTALTPARILDTRSGLGQPSAGPVGQGATIDVQVTGRGGVPASGVSAVVLNVTAVSPTAGGYLTVYPTGASRPTISNLNFAAGQVVPNMTTVALGTGGALSVFNPAGSTHVLFDVVGFYADAAGPAGSRFTSVAPFRRFDTRALVGPIGAGQTLSVDMFDGSNTVPMQASAVVLNVTVTAPTAAGYLRVAPEGSNSTTSSLNFVPGQTVPNLVTVPLPPSGVVDFYNPAGSTHVIADIVGYYGGAVGEAGRFVAVVPERRYDSRISDGPFWPDEVAAVHVGGVGGVPAAAIDGVVLNVAVTGPTAAGYLSVFDDDDCWIPYASSLNFTPGQTVANQVLTGVSSPSTPGTCAALGWSPGVAIYNPVGFTHVVVDVFGYFTSASGLAPVASAASERSAPASSAVTAARATR